LNIFIITLLYVDWACRVQFFSRGIWNNSFVSRSSPVLNQKLFIVGPTGMQGLFGVESGEVCSRPLTSTNHKVEKVELLRLEPWAYSNRVDSNL